LYKFYLFLGFPTLPALCYKLLSQNGLRAIPPKSSDGQSPESGAWKAHPPQDPSLPTSAPPPPPTCFFFVFLCGSPFFHCIFSRITFFHKITDPSLSVLLFDHCLLSSRHLSPTFRLSPVDFCFGLLQALFFISPHLSEATRHLASPTQSFCLLILKLFFLHQTRVLSPFAFSPHHSAPILPPNETCRRVSPPSPRTFFPARQ